VLLDRHVLDCMRRFRPTVARPAPQPAVRRQKGYAMHLRSRSHQPFDESLEGALVFQADRAIRDDLPG
jgi:hypothetical protein